MLALIRRFRVTALLAMGIACAAGCGDGAALAPNECLVRVLEEGPHGDGPRGSMRPYRVAVLAAGADAPRGEMWLNFDNTEEAKLDQSKLSGFENSLRSGDEVVVRVRRRGEAWEITSAAVPRKQE